MLSKYFSLMRVLCGLCRGQKSLAITLTASFEDSYYLIGVALFVFFHDAGASTKIHGRMEDTEIPNEEQHLCVLIHGYFPPHFPLPNSAS
jgi:hypothetical protein